MTLELAAWEARWTAMGAIDLKFKRGLPMNGATLCRSLHREFISWFLLNVIH